jgi:subtilase family serine protease
VWNDTWSPPTNQFIFGSRAPNPLAGGGGRSVFFPRPQYQNVVQAIVGRSRGVPDISMSGACNGAVNVYQSFKGNKPGWYQVCGTSEATPLFAGVVALADQVAQRPLGLINPRLYQLLASRSHALTDVVTGGNTVQFHQGGKLNTVHGFTARSGYDLASGVGTVNGPLFVYALAGKTPPQPGPSGSPQAHPTTSASGTAQPTPSHSGSPHPSPSRSGQAHQPANQRDQGHLVAPTTQIP